MRRPLSSIDFFNCGSIVDRGTAFAAGRCHAPPAEAGAVTVEAAAWAAPTVDAAAAAWQLPTTRLSRGA
jgi:hypothetical protein